MLQALDPGKQCNGSGLDPRTQCAQWMHSGKFNFRLELLCPWEFNTPWKAEGIAGDLEAYPPDSVSSESIESVCCETI